MLTVSQVTKSFGGRTLYENASLQVNRGDRIGLVGPNGAGKSTLFSLILRNDEPDEGQVTIQRGTSLGYLPQESAPAGDETVLELAMAISEEMSAALRAMRLGESGSDTEGEVDAEYHDAVGTFAELDGYTLEAKAKRILAGLAFRETDFQRPARTLSGGWVMRAHLARLLVMEPDLLMLDEPTNHLDLDTLLWFQEYLTNYPGAILLISHDRAFLNALCDGIVEISRGNLVRYRGNYDSYVVERAAREAQHLAAYENQQKEIAHLQQFVDRFRAKASKASQAQERIKRIDRMEKIAAPERDEATVKFSFPQPIRSGHRVLTLSGVHFAYGEKVVYENLDLLVERDQKTVLVGPNGAGKSTLLKLLGGALPLGAGERTLGHNASVGYYAQYRAEMFNPKQTVLQEALDKVSGVSEQTARTLLGAFLFRGDDVFKSVSVLSGGEKSRLALVKILLNPPNLLLMDEPTTHLDMPSIDALVQALKDYRGTLLFVSHDVYFIRSLATSVLHVHAGQLTPYAGDYDYYLDKSQAISARHGLVADRKGLTNEGRADGVKQEPAPAEPAAPKMGMKEIREMRKRESEARQTANRVKRELQTRATTLENEVLRLETRSKELTRQLESSETHADANLMVKLNREFAALSERLETVTADWEKAVEALSTTGREGCP